MPVDRGLWSERYFVEDFPNWPCEHCGSRVRIDRKHLLAEEAAESREAHGHDAWEPEWMFGQFVALLKCDGCGNAVGSAGTWDVVEDSPTDYMTRPELLKRYAPQFFTHPPRIIAIPDETPEAIEKEIRRAFSLFWTDVASCGNAIRTAVEVVLDERRVRKTETTKGKRRRLTLHRRIEAFAQRDGQAAAWLLAVKWIGNAGSHVSTLGREDLYDGFDLLEHVLEHLYSPKSKRVTRLTQRINKRKGPLSKSQGPGRNL